MLSLVDNYLRTAWIMVGLGWAVLLYHLFRLWGVSPDYSDRYCIWIASAGLIYHYRDLYRQLPFSPSRWGRPGMLLAALALPPAWYLVTQIYINSVLYWWITLAMMLGTLSLAAETWGWRAARLLFFPVFFVLYSLPIPDPIYHPIRGELQQMSTGLAARILSKLGYVVLRNGFEIHLPGGALEVVEACSGIRSMTMMTAFAAFIGYCRGFGLFRGLVLVLLSVPVMLLCNAMRIVVTGVLQENFGPVFSQGIYHETIGFLAAMTGLVGVYLISSALITSSSSVEGEVKSESIPLPPARPFGGSIGLLIVSAGFAATLFLVWKGNSRITVDEREAPLGELARQLGEWKGEDRPVNPEIGEALHCSTILNRSYTNGVGRIVNVWVMYWPASSLVKRGHHPEACMPLRGFESISKNKREIPWGTTCQLSMTEHVFRRDSRDQLLYYWTQDGHKFLEYEEEMHMQHLTTKEWLMMQFRQSANTERVPRIGVLIGIDSTGPVDGARRTLSNFTKLFAGELFRVCPWAEPLGQPQLSQSTPEVPLP